MMMLLKGSRTMPTVLSKKLLEEVISKLGGKILRRRARD